MAVDQQKAKIVVGIDFSSHGEAALNWAAGVAARTGCAIEAVHAWDYPWWMATPLGVAAAPGPVQGEVMSVARDRLEQHLSERFAGDEAVSAQAFVGEGGPAAVLADRAAGACMVVVGSRGHGVVGSVMAGSVGRRLAADAPCPVVIVPDSFVPKDDQPIVVGIDGSENSRRSLRWAVDHGAGRRIVAVQTWNPGVYFGDGAVYTDFDLLEESATKSLAESVEAVIADGGAGDTTIEQRVHQGDARVALRGIEADAAMLVLGARGHSGIAELVLGSVTSSLIHKPECPVVVIPQPTDEG
jgi:nucleotide-binding universal stress UspA family protein